MPDHVMNYVETELAAELTLVEWRRSNAVRKPRRRFGLRRRPALAFA
jgi:hypothetical protein